MLFRSLFDCLKTRSPLRRAAKARRCVRPQLEALEDRTVPSTFAVVTDADNGDDVNPVAGSLRAAMLDANAHDNGLNPGGARDVIAFAIPGTGPHTIQPPAALPTITDPVVLDATTQPGFSGTPIIELDGSLAGEVHGLVITAGDTLVRGLVINRFAAPVHGPVVGIVLS